MNQAAYNFESSNVADEILSGIVQILGAYLVCVFILFIIWRVIIGMLCKHLAAEKGYKGHFWIGFLLDLLGLAYVACLPDKKLHKYLRMCSMKMQILDTRLDTIEEQLNN